MDHKVAKSSDIKLTVGLNAENLPVKIDWQAADGPNGEAVSECKAFLLSLFDKDTRDTMKIDLWTTEMQIVEMDRFFYQTLRGLSDTYFKATQNRELAVEMQKFVQYFGEQTEVIPKAG